MLTELQDWTLDYSEIRKLSSGELAGVRAFMFTWGLLVGLDETGYRCRWCYPDEASALVALGTWDGQGESPPGQWIKQKGRTQDGRPIDRSHPSICQHWDARRTVEETGRDCMCECGSLIRSL